MDIESLLQASSATAAFKGAIRAYWEYADAPAISVIRHAPRVKIQRVLCHLLDAEPGLAIDSVTVDATSGCSDFRGVARVTAAGQTKVFHFVWDCQWRARQEGWVDYFGFPDQMRAAREFGWRCFARWDVEEGVPAPLLVQDHGMRATQLA